MGAGTALLLAAGAVPMLAACVTDVRRRIIPDWTAAALAAIGAGAAIAGQHSAGLATTFPLAAAGVVLAGIGVWGWGDAKLLAAAALLVGPNGAAPLVTTMTLTGAALAALLLALRAPVRDRRLALPAGAPRWLQVEQRRLRLAPSIPYGVPIVAGTVAGLIMP